MSQFTDEVKKMASATDTTSTEKKKVVTVTDPKVDAAVREKLVVSRIALLLKAPFFGTLATRLDLVNADDWLSTAATDGRKFYYNSEFVNKLPPKQVEFLMGHEVLHVVYDHMGRRGDRQPALSNIAADYAVNQDLIDQRIGEKITVVPILYDKRWTGMSYEEIYDKLYDEADKIDIDSLLKQLLDDHPDEDDEGEGAGGSSEGKGPGRMSKEERRALRDEIREAVLQAAESAGGAGNLPAGIRRMIKDTTEPQMDWRAIIQQQVQALVKSDYTFMRTSRRSWHMDAILPGSDFDTAIEVDVAIDMSGSISAAMAAEMLGEVKGIMQSFDQFDLNVFTFDTKVYGHAHFDAYNSDEIDEYEPQGGGGTMFECIWEDLKERDRQPKLLLVFTDGFPCSSWGDPDYCDVLFVIHGTTSIVPPFGQVAYYEFAKKTQK